MMPTWPAQQAPSVTQQTVPTSYAYPTIRSASCSLCRLRASTAPGATSNVSRFSREWCNPDT
ncbi:hypothetical protein LB505_004917 [Fusarium chuoi]|nr:hypothetical protein LB505_004917 [Fusarium chuoi]